MKNHGSHSIKSLLQICWCHIFLTNTGSVSTLVFNERGSRSVGDAAMFKNNTDTHTNTDSSTILVMQVSVISKMVIETTTQSTECIYTFYDQKGKFFSKIKPRKRSDQF